MERWEYQNVRNLSQLKNGACTPHDFKNRLSFDNLWIRTLVIFSYAVQHIEDQQNDSTNSGIKTISCHQPERPVSCKRRAQMAIVGKNKPNASTVENIIVPNVTSITAAKHRK